MARVQGYRRLAIGTLATVTVGGGAGAWMYRKRLQENRALSPEAYNAAQDQERLRSGLGWIRLHASSSAGSAIPPNQGMELFRYTTCPYCSKVKAFLDYNKIPHTDVEVEPMFKSQIADSQYKKVPQLRFGGKEGAYLVDSEIIVDTLAEYVGAGAQLSEIDVQKWRAWARESLVRFLVVNINRSLREAWEGYSYIDSFDTIPLANKLFLKAVGAPVMYLVSEYKTRPALTKVGELRQGDDVREAMHQQIDRYVQEVNLSEQRPFHGGLKPDLADLDVYGVFQSVRGHAIYDDILRNTGIAPWMARMDRETGKAAYVPAPVAT